MKMTARGSLAALMTCMAAAGAVTPAAAGEHRPVNVPLEALERPLGMPLPTLSTGVPVPEAGPVEPPRHHPGRLLPEHILPTLPVTTELPPTLVDAPVPSLVGHAEEVTTIASTPPMALRAQSPGASVDAPLSPPRRGDAGLPDLVAPEAGLIPPTLRGQPAGVFRIL
ncbi:hypothetical protein [Streptomyces sp. NPDC051219]|uniref:hypothetical protein n=1 Tax=Streptomyces sp. NPDC051219 TaxID=3155283 RepID=UPI0034187D71